MSNLQAPFPYFGGKRNAAPLIWEAFGDDLGTYVDPFCGSLAVLLDRPKVPAGAVEVVNDFDGLLTNFWRALKGDSDRLAGMVDWPINELDLHARHRWLYERRKNLTATLKSDPEYFDLKAAAWWVWGISSWIGGGWCSDKAVTHHQKPQCSHLVGVVALSHRRSRIERPGGVHAQSRSCLGETLRALSDRLKSVRVLCGDWSRVLTGAVLGSGGKLKPCAILLDPPYGDSERDSRLYACDSLDVASKVGEWCLEHGGDTRLRIALCGYEGEHTALESKGWRCVAWRTHGGFGNQSKSPNSNRHRERIWFSPGCLGAKQLSLIGNGG